MISWEKFKEVFCRAVGFRKDPKETLPIANPLAVGFRATTD
jgi:hypothetical protein